MSLALKLASLILGLPDIKHRYYESCGLRTQIFDTLKAEARGEVVGIATLGDCVKQWFYRRGFETDLEIEELCKASGRNIGEAMHMLCCVLSTNKPKKARKPGEKGTMKLHGPGQTSWIKGKYSTEGMEAVKTLVRQNQQRWKERQSDEEDHGQIPVSTNAASSDPEVPIENADVEELLTVLEDEDCAGQNAVSDRQITDPVSQELNKNEPMDDELSLEASSQFSSLPIEKSRRSKRSFDDAGRKVTIETANTLKTQFVRGEERVSRMINGGMDLNAALLALRGQHLTWNLPKKLANVIGAKDALRVWIEFQPPIHTQAWYPDSSEPHLRTFAFKVGMPNETIEDAHYFWPTLLGGKETPDRADVLAAARNLATFIVRTKYQSHRSS